LRAGYSNDPDSLSVLVSGRVVDIHWNKNGDLAEVLVQSFGTELVQAIKGTHRDGEGTVFSTTHQLLGSLMLEPELAHFGRWEIGKLFQVGEAKDSRLDFKDYGKDKFLGNFTRTKSMAQWMYDHPYLSLGLTLSTGGGFLFAQGLAGATEYLGIPDRIYDYTFGGLKRFFTAQQVSLFLSPQDDNLYPPHPKDYMTLDQGLLTQLGDWVAGKLTATLGRDTLPGKVLDTTYRWWNFDRLVMNKKVLPEDSEYQLLSTTIWKVFHEMTLRHPGWVYAARPYGNEFRYTMFFGVPSQRYWARGASNSFIKRMNDLNQFLKDAETLNLETLKIEYRKLFGEVPDEFLLRDQIAQAKQMRNGFGTAGIPGAPVDAASVDDAEYEARLYQALTGDAIKEYLRGLNFRFVPFRRYHLFTSDRNLVWNGLLSAENAVVNAVDVTYFNNDNITPGATPNPVGSSLFKAHSFIPENKLRIAPVRWPNCKGYNMAMRYGMGELIHRMKDMYRGEIILTGNARIRPWDIGILVDSYNDMVGPVEVERVIHTFSHETGFITEIKPSALVIGNEISSWPMIEAMQTFSLAVIDIEKNYAELRGADGVPDSGDIKTVAQTLTTWGDQDVNDYLRKNNPTIFNGTLEDIAFGGNGPNSEYIDSLIGGVETVVNSYTDHLTDALGVVLGTQAAAATALGTALSGQMTMHDLQNREVLASQVFNTVRNKVPEIKPTIDFPGVSWLIGGPILFLQCLRQDSVMVIPLMKNGEPIVSGLSYHDPTMIWQNFRGDVRQFVDDVLDGTRDLVGEYKQFGTYMWNNIDIGDFPFDSQRLTDNTDLTGGR